MMVILKSSDKVSIAQIDEGTKEIYRQMSQSRSVVKSLYSSDKFPQTWGQLKANDFVCPVIENQTGRVCGFAQILETESKTPEVGIDIMDEFMGKGYGYESTKLLMEYYTETHEVEYFRWKASTDNVASCAIAKKHGGSIVKKKTSIPQRVIDFGKENGILTDEDITYIYIFHIPVKRKLIKK
jgi:RimJ/RimL family protein N-acetyltransferase|uniref:GNAT family N-acetyltransferase n=1 Tax=Enterocloster clostridioformis TaxID=1531 RepID=UPI002048539D|nr:MAG TPA: acetyltransferase domain containing protein [Caudoviricetes sp.]